MRCQQTRIWLRMAPSALRRCCAAEHRVSFLPLTLRETTWLKTALSACASYRKALNEKHRTGQTTNLFDLALPTQWLFCSGLLVCRLGQTRVLSENPPDKQKRPASRRTVPSEASSGIIRRCAPHPSSRGRRRCAPAFLACAASSVERGFSPRAHRINKNAQLGEGLCRLRLRQGLFGAAHLTPLRGAAVAVLRRSSPARQARSNEGSHRELTG